MRMSNSALHYAQPLKFAMAMQAQLRLRFGDLGLRSVSLHAAAAFIASLSSSGFGSADSITPQCHLSLFHYSLSHSYPEGFGRNNRAPTFLHLVGVFLSCQQSSCTFNGSPSFFLLAIQWSLQLLWACTSSPMNAKWWLGLDTSGQSMCPFCPGTDTALDPLHHRAVTCRHGGDVIRHNRLRDEGS